MAVNKPWVREKRWFINGCKAARLLGVTGHQR